MLIYAIILLVILIVWLIVLAVRNDVQSAKRRAFLNRMHKEMDEAVEKLNKQPESEDGFDMVITNHGVVVKMNPEALKRNCKKDPETQAKPKVVAKKKVATKKKVVAKK